MVKRYLCTDRLETPLPSDFVNSTNEKYIEVVACKIFLNDSAFDDEIEAFQEPKFITLHADFIHDKRYLDSYVMYCNDYYNQRKKYEQLARQNKFKIWFKDVDGSDIDMVLDSSEKYYSQTISTEPLHTRKIRFVLELLLIY
jgi:hypothetical protein